MIEIQQQEFWLELGINYQPCDHETESNRFLNPQH